jgi:hypothetical protein
VTETTATILAEWRTRALRDLTVALVGATDVTELTKVVVDTLTGFELDLPFALFYELSPDNGHYRLTACQGLAASTGASPLTLAVNVASPWPVATAAGGRGIVEVRNVASLIQDAATEPRPGPPRVRGTG